MAEMETIFEDAYRTPSSTLLRYDSYYYLSKSGILWLDDKGCVDHQINVEGILELLEGILELLEKLGKLNDTDSVNLVCLWSPRTYVKDILCIVVSKRWTFFIQTSPMRR